MKHAVLKSMCDDCVGYFIFPVLVVVCDVARYIHGVVQHGPKIVFPRQRNNDCFCCKQQILVEAKVFWNACVRCVWRACVCVSVRVCVLSSCFSALVSLYLYDTRRNIFLGGFCLALCFTGVWC